MCVFVCDRSSSSVCACQSPWAPRGERMGGGQASGMLSHLPWVGSRSLLALAGEEEIKPLAFVAGLRITESQGENRGVPYIRMTHPSYVCVCVSICAVTLGGVGSSTFQTKVISSSQPPPDLDKSPPL